MKRGFDFTLMCCGEMGLGKSTIINSLFLGDLYKNRVVPSVSERLERTTKIEKKSLEIEEKGVRLRLTIIDTPGFGDSINCEESWRTCISYIDEQVIIDKHNIRQTTKTKTKTKIIGFKINKKTKKKTK